jgi:hypothetical protein
MKLRLCFAVVWESGDDHQTLGRNAGEAKRMLEAVEAAGIFNGYLKTLFIHPNS